MQTLSNNLWLFKNYFKKGRKNRKIFKKIFKKKYLKKENFVKTKN
jgi:hypothetical protein